jgi:HlyD family secretion protein
MPAPTPALPPLLLLPSLPAWATSSPGPEELEQALMLAKAPSRQARWYELQRASTERRMGILQTHSGGFGVRLKKNRMKMRGGGGLIGANAATVRHPMKSPSSPNAAPTAEDVKAAIGVVAPGRVVRKRIILAILCLLVLAGGIYAVRAVRMRMAARRPTFELAEARRADVQVTVRATGTLQAMTTVEVGAEVTGRLLAVKVEANDAVRKGQVLAEIDPEQLRAAADQANAQVASAEASIQQAKATLVEATLAADRSERLRAEGLVGQNDFEATRASKARAQANLASAVASGTLARASLKSARSKLDKTTIVSPIDGIVLSRLVEPGQTVTAGFTTPILFRLAEDLTRMRLNVDIDEADIGRVREGLAASFTVDAYPERTFPSKVLSLRNEPKTSQNVVTYQAVLAVDNGERLLRPGMTCTATIVAETKSNVLVVPNAALRFTPPPSKGRAADGSSDKHVGLETELRKQHVYTPGSAEPVLVPVRAGVSDGQVTEIVSGELKAGTEVIVDVREGP